MERQRQQQSEKIDRQIERDRDSNNEERQIDREIQRQQQSEKIDRQIEREIATMWKESLIMDKK